MVDGRPYVLIDTAGIRRRGRVREPLERHGAVRALGTLERHRPRARRARRGRGHHRPGRAHRRPGVGGGAGRAAGRQQVGHGAARAPRRAELPRARSPTLQPGVRRRCRSSASRRARARASPTLFPRVARVERALRRDAARRRRSTARSRPPSTATPPPSAGRPRHPPPLRDADGHAPAGRHVFTSAPALRRRPPTSATSTTSAPRRVRAGRRAAPHPTFRGRARGA